ncbi:Bifunctional protein HldE [Escherichia coli]|nr:Bifunctional protein HldE [Escherichia coli]
MSEDCFTAERELVRASRSGWWKNEVWYYRAQILNLSEGMKVTLPEFERAGVMVVGDDAGSLLVRSHQPSPEAPVPVVKVNTIEERPGGAANVAMNIASRC